MVAPRSTSGPPTPTPCRRPRLVPRPHHIAMLLPFLVMSSQSSRSPATTCSPQGSTTDGAAQCEATGWLSAAGFRRVLRLQRSLVVRFDPPGCADCAKLDPLWDLFWQHFESRAWRVDCERETAVCSDAIDWDPSIAGRASSPPASPLVYAWTGANFEPYEGERTAEAVLRWAKKHLKLPGTRTADLDEDADADALPRVPHQASSGSRAGACDPN